MELRSHHKDYLFKQVSSAINMVQGASTTRNYWLPEVDARRQLAKVEWLLSSCLDAKVTIPATDASPNCEYVVQVDGVSYTVQANFCLIDIRAENVMVASRLFDLLTCEFHRITRDTLDGNDEVYAQFIHDQTNGD